MKKILVLGFIILPLSVYSQSEERDSIRAAVNEYIEGRNNGDVERLKNAFLSSASLKGVSRDKMQTIMPIADYIQKQTPGKKQQCTAEIRFVDFVNDVAVAQVILSYPTFSYYDYLVLMKIDGRWIITDKIYTRKEVETTK